MDKFKALLCYLVYGAIIMYLITDGGHGVRDERSERVKQFGALVRLHRQLGLIVHRRSASREKHVY